MGLIEDAKRLGIDEPTYGAEVGHAGYYSFCDGDPGTNRHAPDCPWLAMPRIVKALEAAQRVVAGSVLLRDDDSCIECFATPPSCRPDTCDIAALRDALTPPA